MTIGLAIKEIRKKNGVSQEDLAKAAGITQAALSQIENGRRPAEETLSKISAALSTPEPLIYLMTLEKKDLPPAKAVLYDTLFPILKGLIFQLTDMKNLS